MSEKIKITPRARRLAEARGIDPALVGAKGTGFQGGLTEKDLLAWIEAGGAGAVNVAGAANIAGGIGFAAAVAAASAATPGQAGVRATSLARKVAAELGIGLENVPGTGSYGKIVMDDVLGYTPPVQQKGAAVLMDAELPSIGETSDGKRVSKIVPYAGVRKIIGDRLLESKKTAPHLYFTQKVDMSELLQMRALVNSKQEKKTSVTDYIARAVVMTLRTFPEMNASLSGAGIEEYASVNLGVAVAAPGGLIVPVIKEAQRLSVVGISRASGELIEKAREGRLSPEDYSGGTFTVSNLGMFGIENFTAILNPPEVGILSVSAVKDEPIVVAASDGTKRIDIRPMMNMTLTVDHRVIDGLLAAQFVTEVKRLLESPLELMVRDWTL